MGGGAPDAEVYRFPTVKTDKDDYAPGTKAIITGSGWKADSEVTLVFQEDPAVHDDYVLHVPTDGQGNFSWNQWAPEEHDLSLLEGGLRSHGGVAEQAVLFTLNRPLKAAYRQRLAAGLRNFDLFDFALNGVERGV